MNSNYLYLMHESCPLLRLDFSPSFLHSKKPKVQPLILQENILRGCLASKKKKNRREKRKAKRTLYFFSQRKISLSVKYTIIVSRDDFHPSYSLYKAKPVLANYKDKKGIYIKKIQKKRSHVESAEQRRFRTKVA